MIAITCALVTAAVTAPAPVANGWVGWQVGRFGCVDLGKEL